RAPPPRARALRTTDGPRAPSRAARRRGRRPRSNASDRSRGTSSTEPGDTRLELLTCAAETGRYRTQGDADHGSDLRRRHLFELEQDEHGAQVEVHRLEDLVEQRARAAPIEQL